MPSSEKQMARGLVVNSAIGKIRMAPHIGPSLYTIRFPIPGNGDFQLSLQRKEKR
jgi:hypothetical protein